MKNLFPVLVLIICAFSLCCCEKDDNNPLSVTDIDGNTYNVVIIGDQIWMAENLKVTHYSKGDEIPFVEDGNDWITLTSGAYSRFRNDDSLVSVYGLHYNWHCVNDTRNICPAGWHVPSNKEWRDMIFYLGGDSIAGGKIKETGYEHWENNEAATNSSGFTMLPAGYRSHANGASNSLGIIGYCWTATELNDRIAFGYAVRYYGPWIYRKDLDKKMGCSVRCVKD